MDVGLPTALRILRLLKADDDPDGKGRGRSRHRYRRPVERASRESTTLHAVIEYVAHALRYVDDDLELALPRPGFTDRIRALTAGSTTAVGAAPPGLPARSRKHR